MDAITLLERILMHSPNDSKTLFLLASEYKKLNMHQKSLETLTKALPFAESDLANVILKEISEITSFLVKTNEDINEDEQFDDIEDIEEDEQFDNIEDVKEDVQIEKGNFKVLSGGLNSSSNSYKEEKDIISFKDVGGLENIKNIISMKIIKPFTNPELFLKFKKKAGGGLLLFGPPGCGKTFIAKATAGECNAFFRSVKISDILDPYFGQSEQNLKNIFDTARQKKPCILFFDEIDTLGYNRSKTSVNSVHSIVDTLLTEIEGIDSNTDKILIIGATNMPWDVDNALRRPGRFDRSIFVHPPDVKAREIIFKLKMEDRPCENIDYKKLAQESEFFSGADIENVVEHATEIVLEEIINTGNENLKINQKVLMETLKNFNPTTIEWLRTISTYVKYSNQASYYDDVEKYLLDNKKFL